VIILTDDDRVKAGIAHVLHDDKKYREMLEHAASKGDKNARDALYDIIAREKIKQAERNFKRKIKTVW
jgi:hypothetical protein